MSIGYEMIKGLCIAMGIVAGCAFFGCIGGYERVSLNTISFLVQLAGSTGALALSYLLYHIVLYTEQKRVQ